MTKNELEKKNFDLKQLLEISKSLNSTLDFNILIESILYIVMGQLRVLNVGLFIKEQVDHRHFTLHRNYKGFELDHSLHYEIQDNSDLVKYFQEHTRCATLTELKKLIPDSKELAVLESLNPSLCIPLTSRGKINGLIVVGEGVDGDIFTRSQKEYMLNIALLAAIAIHNSTLYEIASTDMMTKLKMRHFFISALEETFEHNLLSEKTLSVIMLDIDLFKNLNDTYGHTCGDFVLTKVAEIIRNNVRRMDTPARYGGEEFVILLPGADLKITKGVAERIRSQIEKMELEYDGQKITTTISLGIAVLNTNKDFTAMNMVKRADIALYHSKEIGRNTVSVAE